MFFIAAISRHIQEALDILIIIIFLRHHVNHLGQQIRSRGDGIIMIAHLNYASDPSPKKIRPLYVANMHTM
jgi:hypothetical protein